MTCHHICKCGCLQRCRLDHDHDGLHRYPGDHCWPETPAPTRIVRAAKLGVGLRLTAIEAKAVARLIGDRT